MTPTHNPQHYDIRQMPLTTAWMELDGLYKNGWRVVQMATQANGEVVLLMEKKS